ncbi:MAG: hypothetical protein E4G99_08660 [Anaerolineales bacterium]|nr:MAG: hypothetical protein E4G99_08660 [Anaerolineales bacterium]
MHETRDPSMYAFPAVQEQEQLQETLQSLAAFRRALPESKRRNFEILVRRLLPLLPAYHTAKHLTPMEFILLGCMIELAEKFQEIQALDHPPFP